MKPVVTASPAAAPPVEQESWLDWVRGWNRFWFEPAEPTMLGLIRIFCGALTLYVHLSYSFGLLSYVGPEGWGDRKVVEYMRTKVTFYAPPASWEGQPEKIDEGYAAWSVWYHVEDPFWIVTLHVVFLIAMASYTVGFCTRISGVITWIGMLSFVNRMPYMMFGMDAIMVIVQTYLLIGPAGAVYSVDAWLHKRRIGWWRNDAVDPDHPPKTASANLAIRLMQIHFCFVYMVSGLSKLQGASWWSGDAVWGTVANPNFSPMQSDLFLNSLFFLAKHRWLYHVVIGGSVLFTLFVEIGFPTLIWNRRTRWFMVTLSVLLHTGIGFLMGLGGFSLFMMVLLMSFVPPETAVAFLEQLKARWGVALDKLAGWRAAAQGAPAGGKPKEELALHR